MLFAIMFSGKDNSIVGQLVDIWLHVNLCPKGDKFLFNTVGVFFPPYILINRRTNRAFNKWDNFIKNRIRFYNICIHDFNWIELTKYECENLFGIVKSWHQILILFDKKFNYIFKRKIVTHLFYLIWSWSKRLIVYC